MMNTITTPLPTCLHPREAEDEGGVEVTLTLPITMAMRTTMITMDTITTTTGVATMTHTTATTISRGPEEAEEWGAVSAAAASVRPGAAAASHRGAEWASPSEEDREQAEVANVFWAWGH